jgi:F0F1-type ATP synthase assembly protein I
MNRRVITRFFLLQATIAATISVFAGWCLGGHAAAAALFGGGINLLAAMAFVLRVAILPPDATAEMRLATLARAEMVKWGVSIGLFAIAIRLFADQFLVLMLTYLLTSSVYWFALLWDVPGERHTGVDRNHGQH